MNGLGLAIIVVLIAIISTVSFLIGRNEGARMTEDMFIELFADKSAIEVYNKAEETEQYMADKAKENEDN
jgi:uncharacterized protein (UPF0333 family)